MIRVKDSAAVWDIIESKLGANFYGRRVHPLMAEDLGLHLKDYYRLRKAKRIPHYRPVQFLERVSAVAGETIEIDGVSDDTAT